MESRLLLRQICTGGSGNWAVGFLKIMRARTSFSWGGSSDGSKAKTSGRVKIISDLTTDIKGHDVLLVEDIVDSGMTLGFLRKKLMARHPQSLRVCTLLEKPERRKADVGLDYVGFSIPNKYVVGYGLDYQGKYRNLPYIAVLDKGG